MFILSQGNWKIKQTQDTGRGVFAKKDIPPGTVLGDYLGTIINPAEFDFSQEDNKLYLMYYSDTALIYPDLTTPGLYLINHSCMPNCWLYIYDGHTLFFTLRRIFPGEELTISYLFAPQSSCTDCTHRCMCNSILCTGTMHTEEKFYRKWQAFQNDREEKTGIQEVSFNQTLPPLSSYPDSIPDHEIYQLFGNPTIPPLTISDNVIPPIKKMREYIRETGRTILLPKVRKQVLGVQNNQVVTGEL